MAAMIDRGVIDDAEPRTAMGTSAVPGGQLSLSFSDRWIYAKSPLMIQPGTPLGSWLSSPVLRECSLPGGS